MDNETKHIATLSGMPEIGKLYRVPCVLTKYTGEFFKDKWLPVVSNKPHEDWNAINVYERHYHYDFRFVEESIIEQFTTEYNKKNTTGNYSKNAFMLFFITQATVIQGPKMFYLPFLREMPEFPTEQSIVKKITAKIQEYFPHNLNVKITCKRCPHRGTPLNGIAAKDGILTCPAHGLKFNEITGKQIKVKI